MKKRGLAFDRLAAMAFYELLGPVGEEGLNGSLSQLLKGLYPQKIPNRLMELGCGNGRRAEYFASKGFGVTAVDLSPEMIRLASVSVSGRVELVEADAEDLPFEDNEFDVTSIILTLECLSDPFSSLVECIRTTKERIIIVWINPFSSLGMKIFFGRFFHLRAIKNMRLFSRISLENILKRCVGTSKYKFSYFNTGKKKDLCFGVLELTCHKIAVMQPLIKLGLRSNLVETPFVFNRFDGGRNERSISI